jgi:dihydroflavonol-4-reductase
MNILVTGSTGFVGSALCRTLVERGYTVRAFHRSTSDLRLLEGLSVEHVLGDLTQPETVQVAMAGIDAVFHAAAWVGMNDLGRLYAVNVEGTRTIIQAALKAGVHRLVYTSSIVALGFPAPGEISLMDEHRTWNSRPEFFPYGYAKYLAELEIQKGVAQGLDAVIVNPSMILGAGDIYRQSSSIIRQIANRKIAVVVEGGSNVIHVADVADGQIAALERGRMGERYILGGFNVTHLELARLIARVTGVTPPTVALPGGPVRALRGVARLLERFLEIPVSPDLFILAGRYLYCDPAKARIQLNLPEPRPLEQAITESYAWFQGKTNL